MILNMPAGKKLANSIVKEKLAACVNIVPGMCLFLLVCYVSLLTIAFSDFNKGSVSASEYVG